jgi:2-octaprenyl-6-methoxyphenol hydroxylase
VAKRDIDILVVGGGLTGATLMLALTHLGYRVLMIEAKPLSHRIQADFDARTLALSPASVRILQQLKVWARLEKKATPIHTIHISEQHRFGSARLQDPLSESLGYVVEMQHIHKAIHEQLDQTHILSPAELIALNSTKGIATISHEGREITWQVPLVVAADGIDSSARKLCKLTAKTKNYNRVALVTNIGLRRPHQHQAFERFTSSGPLALLPMTKLRASLVWSLVPDEAQRLMKTNDDDFLKALQQTFGYRLGRFVQVGRRVLYPLKQVIMPQTVSNSVVFIGNAAHTLHPVAGQGFNLGLRDVATLAQYIAKEGLSPNMLNHYQQARQHDQAVITQLTDSLAELFTYQMPGLGIARGLGLMTLDNSHLLKKLLSRYARGFAGVIPDLVCGIPLQRSADEPIL